MALELKLIVCCGVSDFTEIKKEIFKNLLVPNRKGYSFDIWYVASSSGPLPSLFIRNPWGQNWSYPFVCVCVCGGGGSQVGTLKQRSPSSKFFLSENGRHRALIFGMQHVLVDLYQQVCSYDAPGVKTGATLESQVGTIVIEKVEKTSFFGKNDLGERSRAIMALLLFIWATKCDYFVKG